MVMSVFNSCAVATVGPGTVSEEVLAVSFEEVESDAASLIFGQGIQVSINENKSKTTIKSKSQCSLIQVQLVFCFQRAIIITSEVQKSISVKNLDQ